ncbi:MAG: hypothetical protein ACXVFQ_08930 [Solirubrobacteraceae bacterium]
MSSVLMVFVVSPLTDPAITGLVTVSGAPVSPGSGCTAEKPNHS